MRRRYFWHFLPLHARHGPSCTRIRVHRLVIHRFPRSTASYYLFGVWKHSDKMRHARPPFWLSYVLSTAKLPPSTYPFHSLRDFNYVCFVLPRLLLGILLILGVFVGAHSASASEPGDESEPTTPVRDHGIIIIEHPEDDNTANSRLLKPPFGKYVDIRNSIPL